MNGFIFNLQRFANISNSTSNTLVSGTSGADTIYSYAENVTISGGAGNDSIYNNWWGSSSSINGGAGNDTLFTKSDGGETLTGGAGNDRFIFYYDDDDLYGTDVITDYAEADTIQFENVAVTSVAASGNNVVFKVGNNKLKVNNAATKTITYIDSNGTRKTVRGSSDSISNSTSNTLVSGTTGDDKIYNSAYYVTINAGAGNDTIHDSSGFYAKINGGDGNDSIYSNWGSFSTIDAGQGNDSIVIYGSGYESVNGGAGNDLISLGGSSSGFTKSIRGGTGNDTVYHGSDHYLLYQYASGDGNDIIYNWTSNDTLQIGGGSGTYSSQTSGSNIVVTVGDGSITLTGAASLSAVNISGRKINFIENYTNNTLVSGTSGADTIYSSAENVTINAGDGNDSIYNNWGDYVSINGGAGNDTLFTKSDGGETLTGGAGNDRFIFYYDDDDLHGTDVITDYAEADTIQFENVAVTSVAASGNNVVFKVGNNKLKVNNAATKTITYIDSNGTRKTVRGSSDSISNSNDSVAVYGTSGNDKIYNSGQYARIYGYAGNDSIYNEAYYATIDAGDGADTINNSSGDYVSINAGAGNDYIYGGSLRWYVTISGGAGNDTITGFGRGSSIDGGAGNDRISLDYAYLMSQTVKGGTGDDTIYLYNGSNEGTLIQYTSGDGNDSIVNFKANDTLQIGGGSGTYSSRTSGSNIVVTVGDGQITLSGAASLSAVNISGRKINFIENYTNNTLVSGTSGADTIYSSYADNVTINAGDGNDSIYNNWGDYVSINGGAGNDTLFTKSDGGETLTGGAGSDRFVFYYDTDSLRGTDVITDYAEEDTIQFENVAVSSVAASGNNVVFTVGNNKLKVNNAATKTITYIDSNGTRKPYRAETNSWTINGTTAKYGTSANTLITVTGVKNLNGISLNGTTVTVANSSVNNSNITISNGYTLALASNVPKSQTTKEWTFADKTAKYNQTKTAGYTLASDAKSVAYSRAATTTLATVKGVKGLNGISLRGKVVTVAKASLGTDNVTISGTGYTLALGSDVTKSQTTKDWTFADKTAKYNQTKTAGYTLASDAKSVAYSRAATTTLATVKGVKGLNGISLRGKVVTVSKASLGTDKVTISGTGYTLALGSNVPTPSAAAASWTRDGSTATYKSAATTAGYTLANNAITYSKATGATKLATIKGVTSTDGLTVSGKTIKPATTSLAKKVTVSGAYTYDFAANYSTATITGSGSNDTIVARGQNLSVNGGNGNDTIKILGTGSVTGGAGSVTGGAGKDVFYYETNGANVIADYAEEDKISLASGTAQSLVSGDDFVLNFSGGGSVTVTGGKTKAVTYIDAAGEHVYRKNPSGVKFSNDGTSAVLEVTYTLDTFDIADYAEYKDMLVTINSSAVKHKLEIMGNKNANKIVGTGEDDFIDGRDGSDNVKGGNGNDTIEGGEGNDILYGGSGDDSLWGGAGSDTLYGNAGEDIFIYYEGNGKDVIADFEEGDIIKVISARIENPYSSNRDVIFEVGESGKITIKDGIDKFIQLYGENGGELAQKWNPQRVSSR